METKTRRRTDPEAFLACVLEQPADPDGWRTVPSAEIEAATGMAFYGQTVSRRVLQDRGVLEVRRTHLKAPSGKLTKARYLQYRVSADALEDYEATS